MVSRRTRSFKDKRPVGIFGQFMFPLAVIMAIVLLYFSIKLFFFHSKGVNVVDVPASRQTATDNVQTAPVDQQRPVTSTRKVIAGPVDNQSIPRQPETKPPIAVTPPATGTKPPIAVTPPATGTKPPIAVTPPAAGTKPPAATVTEVVKRYDVQIGAFSSRDNAVQLVHKARAQGYEVYVNEPENAAPPYRVRAKGPADRQKAEELSAKLKEQGYPVYIIAIK